MIRSADSTTSPWAASASSATPRRASARTSSDFAVLPLFCDLEAARLIARDWTKHSLARRHGRLSRERVRAKVLKLIVAPHAADVVRTMGECGFLEPLLGGMGYPEGSRVCSPSKRLVVRTRRAAASGGARRRASRGRRPSSRSAAAGNAEWRRLAAAASALTPLHGIETPPGVPRPEEAVVRGQAPRRARRPHARRGQSSANADDAAFARPIVSSPRRRSLSFPLAGRILPREAFRRPPGWRDPQRFSPISGSRPDFRRSRRRSTCC